MDANNALKSLIAVLILVATMLLTNLAVAQSTNRSPHLAYVFPAGCQTGTSCEVVIGGQNLKAVEQVHLSGDGVSAEVVRWYRPLTQGEYNKLRMNLDRARAKLIAAGNKKPSEEAVIAATDLTAEQLREMEIYRERRRDPKRQPNDQLAEELTLKVTVAKGAKLGKRDLRLLTAQAMSNPIWFHVGRWPEVRETELNDPTPDGAIHRLPVTMNGQIMPGDTDSFAFAAKKGDKLVITAAARDVIPYLADAVPGWFEAVLTLTDADGKEQSFADSFYFHQDPVVYFEVPRDGNYTIKIRDSIYRGREDFVYRITVGERPFVTSVFPLGARWGTKTSVELRGWNLTQTKVNLDTTSAEKYRRLHWNWIPQANGMAAHFPLQMDRLPEVFDQEPNNGNAAAQEVSPGTIVNGRINYPGDRDVFRISGSGRLLIEAQARRHGSPLDSMLTMYDVHGKELAFNDDYEDKSLGLLTHHADAQLLVSVPKDGCFLHVADAQRNGGEEFAYRLYLRPPTSDFELRVTPATISARPGATLPITVHALRKGGFAEDIELSLVDAPPGFWLAGRVIPSSADRLQLTLTVPKTPTAGPIALKMVGRSRRMDRGQESPSWVTRPVVPAENMMQAFIWNHLVPVTQWNVVARGKPASQPPFEVLTKEPRVTLPRNAALTLPLRLRNQGLKAEEYGVEVVSPEGISAEIGKDSKGKLAMKIVADPQKLEAGTQGNLTVHAYRETTANATAANGKPQSRRFDYGPLPAIPFQVAHQP